MNTLTDPTTSSVETIIAREISTENNLLPAANSEGTFTKSIDNLKTPIVQQDLVQKIKPYLLGISTIQSNTLSICRYAKQIGLIARRRHFFQKDKVNNILKKLTQFFFIANSFSSDADASIDQPYI